MTIRIGTAAWALPRTVREQFPAGASNLARYAGRFSIAEINSSFYRPHRRTTYERWAASVPENFRFAVKLPKAISHEARLADSGDLLPRFIEEIGGLGARLGPVLVQLPPGLPFDKPVADAFFAQLSGMVASVVCEPRHASWFAPDAGALLKRHRVARVAADPAPVDGAGMSGGWPGLAYFRLHGSPRPYWSSYDEAALSAWAARARDADGEVFVVFDNTASGAATANALAFHEILARG